MSKGLREQIADGDNMITYKPLTSEEFSNAMTNVFVKPFTRDQLEFMLADNYVTKEEYTSLMKMIDSPDNENLTIAQAIMELKKPTQDADTIHSRGSQI